MFCLLCMVTLFSSNAHGQGDNFKLGSMRLNLSATLGFEYDSNLGLAPDNEVSDIIAKMGINLGGTWEVTELNTLRLSIGARYDKYFHNPQLDSDRNFLILEPGTGISFIMLIGNFTFRIYDDLIFASDPGDNRFIDPQTGQFLTNILAYNRFENRFGIDGSWEINPYWTATLGLSRFDVIPISSEFNDLQRHDYRITLALIHAVAANLDVGISNTFTINRWKENFQNNSQTNSIGGFFVWQPTDNLEVEGGLFWTSDFFSNNGNNQDTSGNVSAPTGNLTLRHFINPLWQHAITYGRALPLGTVSNTVDTQYADYTVQYDGFARSRVDFGVGWINGVDSGGIQPEDFHRWIFRIGLGYNLSPKLSFRTYYQYALRDSNIPSRNYGQNKVGITFKYDF